MCTSFTHAFKDALPACEPKAYLSFMELEEFCYCQDGQVDEVSFFYAG